MRIKAVGRILLAFSGLILFLIGALVLTCGIGIKLPWDVNLGLLTQIDVLWQRAVMVGAAVLLCALGVYGVSMLFRREKPKGYIKQQTEFGDMNISMRAIDNMVHKCLDAHPELDINSTHINRKGTSVMVWVDVIMASGVNIPLTVNALQKQIKQYITSCSGVDVKEVRVSVETNGQIRRPHLMQGSPVPALDEAHQPPREASVPVSEDKHDPIFAHVETPEKYAHAYADEPVDAQQEIPEVSVEETPAPEYVDTFTPSTEETSETEGTDTETRNGEGESIL